MTVTIKNILFIFQRAPYGSSASREALDAAFAAAAFEQNVQILFSGDGVWHLISDQNPALIHCKDTSKMLQALDYYDITAVYADSVSLAERALDTASLAMPVETLSSDAMRELIQQADCVIGL